MARFSAAERRQQLVEAAMRVATRDGAAAVSTRTVAAEVGVSQGIVHYAFTSMGELFRELIKTMADEQLDAAKRSLAAQEFTNVRDALAEGFAAYWETVEKNPGGHQLTYEVTQLAMRQSSLADLAAWQYQCYFDVTGEFLEAVAAAVDIEWSLPVSTIARMTVVINDGVTLAWLADRDGDAARAVYAAFIDQIVTLARTRQDPS